MNENETFIRAIVDGRGDETARLVYADWLDDRDDPRGPYLRAEAEWGKSWRDGQPPGDSSELRKLAARLDPVWVTRVSRPPVGVCCDHVEFTERGPQLTQRDVDQFAKRNLFELADDYRAFLLNYNGGVLVGNDVPILISHHFYPLIHKPKQGTFADLKSVYRQYRTDYLGRHYFPEDSPWHWNYLPIATLGAASQLCLGIGPAFQGMIYELIHSSNYNPLNATKWAASFSTYLSSLYGDSRRAVADFQ